MRRKWYTHLHTGGSTSSLGRVRLGIFQRSSHMGEVLVFDRHLASHGCKLAAQVVDGVAQVSLDVFMVACTSTHCCQLNGCFLTHRHHLLSRRCELLLTQGERGGCCEGQG